ncbi:hypothetical protein Pfo_015405 [Paulownia fortunei]|nr:hypothetical protein Pfo_015405 [Paulownia fortunei]
MLSSPPSEQICQLQTSIKELTFGESDLEGRQEQHNDALVISATHFWVKKILVDSGSFADIIFYDAFLKLGIDNVQLSSVNTPLIGFGGEVVETLKEVALHFSLGSYLKRVTKMEKFLVVNAPLTYNMILGRPSLNLFYAITSTYHMKLKFPTKLALHQLNVNPSMKPIKQKKRTFEVNKLLAAKYIRQVQYPEWLANVVLVLKSGDKWHLCIDFTDLNKACPKDPFSLLRIDKLVDSTSGCELLSFLDAYQGYNQIRLTPEDQEMTSFITDQGIYCYKVMPFGYIVIGVKSLAVKTLRQGYF